MVNVRTLLIASAAVLLAGPARAQLNGSLEEWKKHFGNAEATNEDRSEFRLSKDGLEVQLHLGPAGKVNCAAFLLQGDDVHSPHQEFTPAQVKRLLELCAPGRRWRREGAERVVSTDGKVVAWFKRPLGMLVVAERNYLFDPYGDFPENDVRRAEGP
jgi:hypothetical protein